MNSKITQKECYTALAISKDFIMKPARRKFLCSEENIAKREMASTSAACFESTLTKSGHDSFESLIAGLYDPAGEVPEGFVARTIPAFT